MKSLTLIKLLICCLLINFSYNLKTNSEKAETVMEFLNNMFVSDDTGKDKVKDVKDVKEVKDAKEVKGPAVPNPAAPSQEKKSDIVEDWLQISSPLFKDTSKFPPVILPDGTKIGIKSDNNNFRLNEAFKSENPDKPLTELDLWFRLSGTHIYYTLTKSDINVIGAIAIENIENAKSNSDSSKFCFSVDDKEKLLWNVCAVSEKIKNKWVCAINKSLKRSAVECEEPNANSPSANVAKTIIEQKVIQPIILIPLPSKKCNADWNYDNHGTDWECTCSDGKEQSPIDLPEVDKVIQSPVSPLFQYEEVQAKSPITSIDGQVKSEQYIKIKYFSNSLRIFHPNLGKIVTLDGAVYVAEEIVFHTPAEHTIGGKRYDMEMQVVHYGQSQGDISKQVVLSFLFQKKPGVYNKFMDDVDFFSLPNSQFPERDITNNLFIPKVFYSSDDSDIPELKPFSFYTYQGSITSPPCTERTIHYVASEPIPLSSAALELIKEALKKPDMKDERTGNVSLGDESLSENYRTTQPLNERPVFYFDHKKYCETTPKPEKLKQKGHYEKVPRKATQYFFVNGNEPSGMPGAFVVDEQEAKQKTKY